ncbi:MAG: polymer-forming cytoskeletal protein [Pseudomonadota bacterium]|nr:polymer-forming cytoskeletal protein [Pseudomonadota bacterium]
MSELKGPLHIDGHVEGVIDTQFDVSIGVSGQVSGLVKARAIALSGTLEGKVACEKIDILQSGKLIGELISGELTVETGGKFIGQSHEMTEGGMVVSLPETFAQLNRVNEKPSEPKNLIDKKESESSEKDSE